MTADIAPESSLITDVVRRAHVLGFVISFTDAERDGEPHRVALSRGENSVSTPMTWGALVTLCDLLAEAARQCTGAGRGEGSSTDSDSQSQGMTLTRFAQILRPSRPIPS